MDQDRIELFDDEADVEVRTPSLSRVLLTLAGAGVLVAVVVILLANLVTFDRPAPDTLCDGAASCNDLSVEEVNDLAGIELPLDSEVISSSYESTADQIVVEATVRMPIGSANPFDGGAYFPVDDSSLTVPNGLSVFEYYAAVGEMGALEADAALADDGLAEIVVVRVVRTL